jgi:hypothetical protein
MLFSFVAFIQPSSCFAWGREGHHIVAEIAYKYLSEQARTNVMNYLGGISIDEAGVWMDEMRSDKSYDYMKPWHYINIEKGDSYTPNTEENVVNEIQLKMRELDHMETLSVEQIKTGLLVLFHLVGDIHQPLHAGYGSDRGGNSVPLNFLGEATNLHTIWDSKIIQQQKITMDDCIGLMNSFSAQQLADIKKIDVVAWMNQSRSYVETVYDFNGLVIGEDYAGKNKGIIEKQLLYAGLRLAAVLEQYFGKSMTSPNKSAIATSSAKSTITAEEAANHIGEAITVCGKVYGGKYLDRSNGKPTMLNIGAAYPKNPFTIVIFGDDRGAFSYAPEQYLDNKNICVTGLIKLYNGKPEIIVAKESQIEVK